MKCPECGSQDLRMDGELHCKSCGLVLDEALPEERPEVTEITKKYAEHPGLATAGTRAQEGRIVRQQWLLTTREKNIQQCRLHLDLIASKHQLTDVVKNEAILLYKSALDKDINVGRSNLPLMYACVFAACTIHDTPKTQKELTAFTEVSAVQMHRAYRLLKKELNLRVKLISPLDLVHRFGYRLKLSQETITSAIDIIMKVQQTGLTAGRRPDTIAAAALYTSARNRHEEVTQRDVANAVGVIEITIRKICKRFKALS